MGRRSKNARPQVAVHRASGRARVRVCGREIWLGQANSVEAAENYQRVLIAWIASGGANVDGFEPVAAARPAPAPAPSAGTTTRSETATAVAPATDTTSGPLSIAGLVARYLTKVRGDRSTEELRTHGPWWNARQAANALASRGRLPLSDLGPLMLGEIQRELANTPIRKKDGQPVYRSRGVVNRMVQDIRQIVKWAVSQEYLPPDRLVALQCVAAIRRGETLARETSKRVAISDETIAAVVAHLPPVLADLVTFARRVGCRPGEACQLRMEDIGTTMPDGTIMPDGVWLWTLKDHKNAHRGMEQVYAIGPVARTLVERWSPGRSPDEPVFAVEDLKRATTSGTIRFRKRRKAAMAFKPEDLRKAIDRACAAAGVPRWTPHLLRHSAAKQARREMGLDAAQAMGGWASREMANHYSQLVIEDKAAVAKRIG